MLGALPYQDIPPLEIGPLKLYPFGFLVGIAIILGTVLADRRAKKWGLNPAVIAEASLWAVIPGFIVAHLYAVIFYTPDKIADNPLVLLQFWNGISSFGGFIGGAGGVVFYFRRKKIPFWPYADCIAYGFTFAWIFGRLGCTVAFDHPGDLTDFALAMPYPDRGPNNPVAGLRHNLGFYEALWSIALAAYFYTQRNKPHKAGFYLTTFVLAYMPVRFVWDFLRAADATYLGLTPGQYAAIVLFGIGLWMFNKRMKADETLVSDGNPHIFPDGSLAIEPEKPPSRAVKKKTKSKKKRA